MELVDSKPRNRRRTPAIEALEARGLLAVAAVPDIAMISAMTSDSRSVTFDYEISGAAVDQPIQFAIDRSASSRGGPDDQAVGGVVVNSAGPSGPTLDQEGNPATAVGEHQITVALTGGLPPLPDRPYVVVTADPAHAILNANEPNNTASFRTYVIGVITHGGVQPKSWTAGPPWEHRMAKELKAQGYDAVIPFNWVAESNHAGAAVQQVPRLVKKILQVAGEFPANAPVDLHFIGHSEGTVINSQAILLLNKTNAWTPGLKAGYLKVTMLDPHAANNAVDGQQYSVSNGFLGEIARTEINAFQSKAEDPAVVVPPNVQDAEVFFQHTPIREAGGSNDGIYNLWGQVPVHGPANYFNLTAPGISHAGKFGVQDWYLANVVPTLGAGAPFVQTDTLTGGMVSQSAAVRSRTSPGGTQVEYAGTAAPGARVELLAAADGKTSLSPLGTAVAGPAGTWELTTHPLRAGQYRVLARSNAPIGPRDKAATMHPLALLGKLTVAPG